MCWVVCDVWCVKRSTGEAVGCCMWGQQNEQIVESHAPLWPPLLRRGTPASRVHLCAIAIPFSSAGHGAGGSTAGAGL